MVEFSYYNHCAVQLQIASSTRESSALVACAANAPDRLERKTQEKSYPSLHLNDCGWRVQENL
jgi:hypothetical protein